MGTTFDKMTKQRYDNLFVLKKCTPCVNVWVILQSIAFDLINNGELTEVTLHLNERLTIRFFFFFFFFFLCSGSHRQSALPTFEKRHFIIVFKLLR